MTELTGWGRYPKHESEWLTPANANETASHMAGRTGIVARGNGRAYGDAAIGHDVTLATARLDRMRRFDPTGARLTAEAGVLLSDILAAFVPRGLFPPVVPGTKFVTIGGMIAADVHGKNHHCDGGFGAHVEELQLALPGGEVVACSPARHAELFHATVGGMGLTGTILEATFPLKRIETGWMRHETVIATDLAAALATLTAAHDTTYSVAWIDCLARGAALGRSLIFLAEHATLHDLEELGPKPDIFPGAPKSRLSVPLDLPAFALTRPLVSTFNALYFHLGGRQAGRRRLIGWNPYFFPLDGIGAWNRAYGARGFLQHQCVVPVATAPSVLGEILERISLRGNASFLAVLKRLGAGSGLISFPSEGFTLTLDLQVNDEVFALLDEIDRLVVAAGGRLYLAKDARQSRATFEASYPDLRRFRDIRRAVGAEGHITSRLSARLCI